MAHVWWLLGCFAGQGLKALVRAQVLTMKTYL